MAAEEVQDGLDGLVHGPRVLEPVVGVLDGDELDELVVGKTLTSRNSHAGLLARIASIIAA